MSEGTLCRAFPGLFTPVHTPEHQHFHVTVSIALNFKTSTMAAKIVLLDPRQCVHEKNWVRVPRGHRGHRGQILRRQGRAGPPKNASLSV